MKVILVLLLASYSSALTENTVSLSLGSNPSISISSDNGLGLGLGVGSDADSTASVSVSSQGSAALSDAISSLGDSASTVEVTARGVASSDTDASAEGGATSSLQECVHKLHSHGLGLWGKMHDLQHLLKDNSNDWNAEAVQAWIKLNGAEFPKVNWANITLNNGQGFKFSQLFGSIRSAQSDAAKQLQALLTENSNNWNSEAVTKWIADNGANFHVNWTRIVATNGNDFKIEELIDRFTTKKRFDAIQQLQVILRDTNNDWKSDAVTKWIANFGAKFKGTDWQKIVADNGKNFTIDSLLGLHVQRFRVHDLHTRLADNEHNWDSESVRQWIKQYGTQFPSVDWTTTVGNNGEGFNWHKLHAHAHTPNRNPVSQLIKIIADNNNDWSAETVTKWITDNGAKYPEIKWSEAVSSNGVGFNWDQLLPKHHRFGAQGLNFWPGFAPSPAFGGFGGGIGGGNGFGFGSNGNGAARGRGNGAQAFGFGTKSSGSSKLNLGASGGSKKSISASGSSDSSSSANTATNANVKVATATNVAVPSVATSASLSKTTGLNVGSNGLNLGLGGGSGSGLNLGLGGGSKAGLGLGLGLGGGSNTGLNLGLDGGSKSGLNVGLGGSSSSDGFLFGNGASRSTSGSGLGLGLGLGAGLSSAVANGLNSGLSLKLSNKAATDANGSAGGSVSVSL